VWQCDTGKYVISFLVNCADVLLIIHSCTHCSSIVLSFSVPLSPVSAEAVKAAGPMRMSSIVFNPLTPTVWVSECPDVKNFKWHLNPLWHRMLYSCTLMATVGIKGLNLFFWACAVGLWRLFILLLHVLMKCCFSLVKTVYTDHCGSLFVSAHMTFRWTCDGLLCSLSLVCFLCSSLSVSRICLNIAD